MSSLAWILIGSLVMSTVAMSGALTFVLSPRTLERLLLPFVALAAGTLLGGAFFHMLPEGIASLPVLEASTWLVGGFTVFFALEQFLRWHHTHRQVAPARPPVTYLILIGDAVHNFLGGLGIASTFLLSPEAGIGAWVAAVAHEVPQEIGDFGILVHGGWPRGRALFWNVMSALTFPAGALLAYFVSLRFDVGGLVMFGAGNFIYIAASDLIPEIKAETSLPASILHFAFCVGGLAFMLLLATLTRS